MKEFRSQFRIPGELAEKLKQAAEVNHRSLNAEIVDRLQSTMDDGGKGPSKKDLERIDSKLDQIISEILHSSTRQ